MLLAYLVLLWVAARRFAGPAWSWRKSTAIVFFYIVASFALFLVTARALDILWMPGGYALFPPRARKFSSGLSPLVSLAWLLAALFTWCVFEINREAVRRRYRVPWPAPRGRDEPPLGLEDAPKRGDAYLSPVEKRLRRFPSRKFWILFGCVFGPPVLFVLSRTMQPIAESKLYGRIFLVAVLAVFVLSATSFYRFLSLWRVTEKILDWLDHTRLEDALSRSSPEVAWNPMKAFGWQLPRLRMAHLSWDKLRAISRRRPRIGVTVRINDQLDRVFREEAEKSGSLEARQALNKIFQQADQELVAFRGDRYVDDYFAVRTAAYIRHLFAHIHNSLACAMSTLILLLIAVRTYAFEPKQFVSVGLLGATLGAIVITFWTFLQMDRNPILCKISGTPPGQVTFDRYLLANVFTYVAIPLGGIVITQFPEVGRYFVGWLNPLLRIVGAG